MATMDPTVQALRQAPFAPPTPELRAGLKVAAVVGAAVLAAAYLAPIRAPELSTVDNVPERLAKLILEEPKKAPPAARPAPPQVKLPAPPKVEAKPAPEVVKAPPPRPAPRRAAKPEVPADKGTAGRELAQEQVKKLESVTASLDGMLADVSASLTATNEPESPRRTTRRRTRSGRSASEVASVEPVSGASAAGASALSGALVQLGDPAASGLPQASAVRGDGSTVAAGEVRSDAELMAVVRKYAPGLQFCYDNELRSSPGLGGKLVVSLTVAASGHVSDAAIVVDTVGSAAMAECALTQIRAWKFPPVPEGSVTFQVPFVYTPPE